MVTSNYFTVYLHGDSILSVYVFNEWTTKIQKYYDEVVNAHDALERGVISEKEAIHRVERLYAPAYSDVSKQKAPKQFAEFMKLNIENIKSARDLKAFKEHFESIVCFYPEKK